MSASLAGPGDYSHYYSSSVDSTRPSTDSAASSDIQKKDSLGRRAAYGRKGTGGTAGSLKRQSIITSTKRDSAESGLAGQDYVDSPSAMSAGAPGVQLEDKPMDFD